jgi:hypothetical protein
MIGYFVGVLQWLNDTPLAESVRGSVWAFPIMECIHVLAIVLVVGSIARLDLRLLGLASRDRPVSDVAGEMLPWTWTSFVVAAALGLLLFISKPLIYLSIPYFTIKMALIMLAGINMLVFQQLIAKNMAQWNRAPTPPLAVRTSAGLSLGFWVTVVFLGRFVGFV